MIQARIKAGMERVRAEIARSEEGIFTSRKSGIVRRSLGRPGADPAKIEAARAELAKGTGVVKTARLVGLGTGTVHNLKREMIT